VKGLVRGRSGNRSRQNGLKVRDKIEWSHSRQSILLRDVTRGEMALWVISFRHWSQPAEESKGRSLASLARPSVGRVERRNAPVLDG